MAQSNDVIDLTAQETEIDNFVESAVVVGKELQLGMVSGDIVRADLSDTTEEFGGKIWYTDHDYVAGDIVSNAGIVYVATAPNVGALPPESPEVWVKVNEFSNMFISENITKTVGLGKDFNTLHEALRWAENTILMGHGVIELVLDDGTHVIGEEDEFNSDLETHYCLRNNNIKIRSDSYNMSSCTITLDAYDDGNTYPYVLSMYRTDISFDYLTFDMTLGGYPYIESYPIVGKENSYIKVNNCKFVNCETAIEVHEASTLNIGDTYIDGINKGILLNDGSRALTTGYVYISNTVLGIGNNRSFFENTSSVVFTSNTEDTNIPLDEVQYNGSYIATGNAALSFKA